MFFVQLYLCCFLFVSSLCYAKPSKAIKEALDSSVQVIIPEQGIGSGVVLANVKGGSIIATNDHVCQVTRGMSRGILPPFDPSPNLTKPINTFPASIVTVGGSVYSATVIKTSNVYDKLPSKVKRPDLCLLFAKVILPPISLAKESAEIGEELFVVSGPSNIFPLITRGYVGGTYSDEVMTDIRSSTIPINHGSSGGGVFNEQGELVGVAFSLILDEQTKGFVASFYVELEDVKTFLKSCKFDGKDCK